MYAIFSRYVGIEDTVERLICVSETIEAAHKAVDQATIEWDYAKDNFDPYFHDHRLPLEERMNNKLAYIKKIKSNFIVDPYIGKNWDLYDYHSDDVTYFYQEVRVFNGTFSI